MGDSPGVWPPDGTIVRLCPGVRVRGGGATLIGGSRFRTMRLKPAARQLIQDGHLTVRDTVTRVLADHLMTTGMAQPDLGTLPVVHAADITCVVPVKDRPHGLAEVLDALADAFPVVVVDDASDDPEPVATVANHHAAQLIRLSRNRGPAGARNAGLAAVRTAYTLCVDSDVTATPDQVLLLARRLADPQVALVAPRVLGDEHPTSRPAAYETSRSSLDLGPTGGPVHPHSRIAWLPAACILARTEALGTGFDAAMRAGEDVDLVWRLVRAGKRVVYEPRATVRHRHRDSYAGWLGRKVVYGTGAAPLAARHGDWVAPAAMSPLGAAVAIAALAQRRWSVPAVAGLAAIMVARLTRALRGGPRPLLLATELTAYGLASIGEQVMGLLLRHWWPIAAAGALRSRRVRRALLAAAVCDSALEYLARRPRLDPATFAVLRRLDDLAYGAGVWSGAVRARSARALIPRIRAMGRP